MKKTLLKILTISLPVILLTGCFKGRDEVYIPKDNSLSFNATSSIKKMPNLKGSEKRGFADFDCDNIEDMVQINDEKFWGQDYKFDFFKGYYEDGTTKYLPSKKINISINKKSWGSSQIKFDTADIDGNGCADIIITSVQDKLGKGAVLRMSVAMNQGDLTFTSSTTQVQTKGVTQFTDYFSDLVREISLSEDESLSDYIKMDWADFDGNGSDDFAIFMEDGSSLSVGIFYTEKIASLSPQFVEFDDFWIPHFLYGVSIRNLDTADITGNGKADIATYMHKNENYLKFAVALNKSDNFIPHKDIYLKMTKENDFFSKAKKLDIYDDNGDGSDDFVFITEIDDQPVKYIWNTYAKKM